MSHVTCHMSRVTCRMSHVACHLSHVTCHMSHVTCHLSHVTCHVSHVTCHMLHVADAANPHVTDFSQHPPSCIRTNWRWRGTLSRDTVWTPPNSTSSRVARSTGLALLLQRGLGTMARPCCPWQSGSRSKGWTGWRRSGRWQQCGSSQMKIKRAV